MRGLVAVEIADEANAECDAVEVIAMHMAAVDLASPPIAYFDLAVAGRATVADDKVVCESIRHPSNMPMIVIEHGGIALPRSAVVYSNKLPATARDRGAIDRSANRTRQVAIPAAASPKPK